MVTPSQVVRVCTIGAEGSDTSACGDGGAGYRGPVSRSNGDRPPSAYVLRGFWPDADLDPDALAKILADCAKFQDSRAWVDTLEGHQGADEEHAGRDFWYTRNGHGCGFWDGDWPEPYATQLTDATKAFGEVNVYLSDDGKVCL